MQRFKEISLEKNNPMKYRCPITEFRQPVWPVYGHQQTSFLKKNIPKTPNEDSLIYILAHISEIKLCQCNSSAAIVTSPPNISKVLLEGLVQKFYVYI